MVDSTLADMATHVAQKAYDTLTEFTFETTVGCH